MTTDEHTGGVVSMTRRQALSIAVLPLVTAGGCILDDDGGSGKTPSPVLKIGMMTDVHHADKAPLYNRYFRDSYEKLSQCMDVFESLKPDFVIQLGDVYNDTRYRPRDIVAAEEAISLLDQYSGDTYHVLGNHDVSVISREEYLELLGIPSGYYSFDTGGFHCVVLDANYKLSGSYHESYVYSPGYNETYVLEAQQNWLRQDLAEHADTPSIIFIHQCLDLPVSEYRAVKNNPDIRQILEEAGNVRYVFQGHEHTGNYSFINGIHYVTLRGMVEGPGLQNNSYGFGEIGLTTGTLDGFVMQPDYGLV